MIGRRKGRSLSLLHSYGAGHSSVKRAVVRKASRGVESTRGLPVGHRRNISGSPGYTCPEDDVVRAGSERPGHGASNRDVYRWRCEIIGVGSCRDRSASRRCRGRLGHGRPCPSTPIATAASHHEHRCGRDDRTSDVHIPSTSAGGPRKVRQIAFPFNHVLKCLNRRRICTAPRTPVASAVSNEIIRLPTHMNVLTGGTFRQYKF